MSATPGPSVVEPLSTVPSTRLATLRGLAFDIDDTVTRDGRLEPQAFDAMWRLHQAGLTLVAVTGRPIGWADVVARHWPVDVAVGENGAGWVRSTGHRTTRGFYEDDETLAAHTRLLGRVQQRVTAELPALRLANDAGARRCDLAYDVAEDETVSQEDVARLVAIFEEMGCHATVSSVHAHAAPGDWNKARGCSVALRDGLGRDLDAELHQWAFIGDSGNDAAAFAYFPLSVGVANLRRAHLQTPPKYITDGERGDGFMELARSILAARTSP